MRFCEFVGQSTCKNKPTSFTITRTPGDVFPLAPLAADLSVVDLSVSDVVALGGFTCACPAFAGRGFFGSTRGIPKRSARCRLLLVSSSSSSGAVSVVDLLAASFASTLELYKLKVEYKRKPSG